MENVQGKLTNSNLDIFINKSKINNFNVKIEYYGVARPLHTVK